MFSVFSFYFHFLQEYEEGKTAESKFVKDLDRLDLVMQAFEYEKRDNCPNSHQEFFDAIDGKFNHPFVVDIYNRIKEQRQQNAENGKNLNGEHSTNATS